MKTTLLPKTRTGKWAVAMFIVFIALMIAAVTISSMQDNNVEYPNPFNNLLLGSVIYLMFFAAIIASIAGLIAVKKNNERSFLVYLSIPLSLLYFIGIIILLAGVIIGPPN